jgi:hypothetical protein
LTSKIIFLKIAERHGKLFPIALSIKARGWGFSSVIERLPSMGEALGSIPSITHTQKNKMQVSSIHLIPVLHIN